MSQVGLQAPEAQLRTATWLFEHTFTGQVVPQVSTSVPLVSHPSSAWPIGGVLQSRWGLLHSCTQTPETQSRALALALVGMQG